MSGMGATAADYEHTGRPGIFRSNFSDERETLYRNRGKAEFDDATVIGRNGAQYAVRRLGMRILRFR